MSEKRKVTVPVGRSARIGALPSALAQSEDVAVRIAEPGALRGPHLGDVVDGLEWPLVVIEELHAAALELADQCVESLHFEVADGVVRLGWPAAEDRQL